MQIIPKRVPGNTTRSASAAVKEDVDALLCVCAFLAF